MAGPCCEYTPTPLSDIEELDPSLGIRRSPSGTRCTFNWLGRKCTGIPFHLAAVQGDEATAASILLETPEALETRFQYWTHDPKGRPQEGSGEAIHIAAALVPGNLELVRLLVECRARLDTKVTRAGLPHYDVLHAAVFAGGQGGCPEIVRYLLSMNAPLTSNLDGHYPMHKAFQTGATDLIDLLRAARDRRGCEDEQTLILTPLEMGIKFGRMNEAQLALVAPATPESLEIFIRHEPRCIRYFLQRCKGLEGLDAKDLARNVSQVELAKLIRDCPGSVGPLLDAVTSVPEVESSGWHPLPARLGFHPRTLAERLFSIGNPVRPFLALYVSERIWRFDPASFQAPAWHAYLLEEPEEKCIRCRIDIDVCVCHVRNLANIELMASLAGIDSRSDEIHLLDHAVIRGLVAQVWFDGPIRAENLTIFLDSWALALLVLDELDPKLGLSVTFVGARGFVDLWYWLVALHGYWRVGRTYTFMWGKGSRDLLQLSASLFYFCSPKHDGADLIVIIVYWLAVFRVYTLSESIAHILLPIAELVKGLMPAMVPTVVCFCLFTHAFAALSRDELHRADERSEPMPLGRRLVNPARASHDTDTLEAADDGYNSTFSLKGILFQSFATLFTAQMPSDPNINNERLVLTYVAVLAFSMFFINIFIGVISEQYIIMTEMSFLHYRSRLAFRNSSYMVRCCKMPFRGLSRACSVLLAIAAGLMMLGLQVACVCRGGAVPGATLLSVLCMSAMLLAAFQEPQLHWSYADERAGYYIWTLAPRYIADESGDQPWQIQRDSNPALHKRWVAAWKRMPESPKWQDRG